MLIEYRSQLECPEKLPQGRQSALVLGEVWLSPGFNDVNPTKWKNLLKNEVYKNKIEAKQSSGILLVANSGDAEKALLEETPAVAARIVKETFDVTLLTQWKNMETDRKGVIKAIDEQIKKIEAAGNANKEATEA